MYQQPQQYGQQPMQAPSYPQHQSESYGQQPQYYAQQGPQYGHEQPQPPSPDAYSQHHPQGPYGGQQQGAQYSHSQQAAPYAQQGPQYGQPQQGAYAHQPTQGSQQQHTDPNQQTVPTSAPSTSTMPQASSMNHNNNAPQLPPTSVTLAPNPCSMDENGLRWTWSAFPNTERGKGLVAKSSGGIALPEMVVPLAAMYTPLHPIANRAVVQGLPTRCKHCGAVWSRHGRTDAAGQFWACPACLNRNPLPANYAPDHPALLQDTVEYVVGRAADAKPVFLFVVDTCIIHEELEALRRNLARCLDWIPPQALVGFISFGQQVTVWELGPSELSACYSLRGMKQYKPAELSQMLGLCAERPVLGRFLCPLEDCEFMLSSIIEELVVDPFPVPTGFRPQRATGSAIDIAVHLLENVGVPHFGRISLFAGGPCTRGPGLVVGARKDEMLRFHRDFTDGNVPHYEAAVQYYQSIERRLNDTRACLDVFVASFDQVGVCELRNCVNNTGGFMVCGDTFDHAMFNESFSRYFGTCTNKNLSGDINVGFGVSLELHLSNNTLVCGAVGPCNAVVAQPPAQGSTAAPTSRLCSPNAVGAADTTQWRVSALDKSATIAFVLDTEVMDAGSSSSTVATEIIPSAKRFVQFITKYTTVEGEERIRVTSVSQSIAPNSQQFFQNNQLFDQACAASVISRLSVWNLEQQDNRWDVTRRWLDRLLVSFVRRFGSFRPNEPDSLRLQSNFSLFPMFIFNLRRSEYFMMLNISPDETSFKRHWLLREPSDKCILMIQPTLHSYSIQDPHATPVPLDSASIQPDNVLLMDAFFNIHILWGSTVFAWQKMKYHESPDYPHFKTQLDNPEHDAQALLEQRFPFPRFSRTDVNGSEARHVKMKMNPTTTHNNTQQAGDNTIYTDDASIARFMQTLKAAVVSTAQ